jgi:hypothetical protein
MKWWVDSWDIWDLEIDYRNSKRKIDKIKSKNDQ